MTHAIQDVVVRDIDPVDTDEITAVLAAAMSDGAVARWLMPDASVRRACSPDYFAIFAEHAVRFGEVYATVDPIDGQLSGVALWFPLTRMIPPPYDYDRRLKEVAGAAFDRACELDAAFEAHHPVVPHHYLAFLAVRPDRQNLGIGSSMLARHHARLDRAGLPAYLESNDPRNRELYLRHGYVSRAPIMLPDGPPVWPMWREPYR
ncbi:GNAT family N-acetyltransferase [Dactylosporangium sp. AC04546]|uniref:GNAT family N-acetyltransferase n=1 Tax=Dactylosporangium sp. AC04546 TaxID=2862460 RepID=UPI001EDF2146|nr:GNAT family N-acetyltransferase [Dactylosporangium sp. AC04546]WVK87430.1 GNAT family N-acetyltransferase [Dactylosporangium sp. AC04546]